MLAHRVTHTVTHADGTFSKVISKHNHGPSSGRQDQLQWAAFRGQFKSTLSRPFRPLSSHTLLHPHREIFLVVTAQTFSTSLGRDRYAQTGLNAHPRVRLRCAVMAYPVRATEETASFPTPLSTLSRTLLLLPSRSFACSLYLAEIPEKYQRYGIGMAQNGKAAKTIHEAISDMANTDRVEITWTYDDVRNSIVTPHRPPGWLDISGLHHWLVARREEQGLGFEEARNEDGELSDLFVELPHASEAWGTAVASGGGCLLFDTTHGTTRYGWKLGVFIMVDGNGKTRILALSLHLVENKDNLTWAFQAFEVRVQHVSCSSSRAQLTPHSCYRPPS